MTAPDTDPAGSRPVRVLVSSRSAAVSALSGYLFGVMGFYTNFFVSLLQATAFLVDVVTLLALVSLVVTGAWRPIWQRAGRRRAISGSLLAAVLVAVVNIYGILPPGVVPAPQEEACAYDVTAGVAVPLVPGGSISQQLRPGTDRISSVSVIAAVDPRTGAPDQPHSLKLVIRASDGEINRTLQRDDLVPNSFSRFQLPEPIEVSEDDELVIRVENMSAEPVSVYVKKPDATDLARPVTAWAFVKGHQDNEAPYEMTGFKLSGCVTRPGA